MCKDVRYSLLSVFLIEDLLHSDSNSQLLFSVSRWRLGAETSNMNSCRQSDDAPVWDWTLQLSHTQRCCADTVGCSNISSELSVQSIWILRA